MTTRIQADSSNSQGKSSPPRLARHWIDGGWVGSDLVSKSINPAAGAVLGQWADGGESEARAAIAAASRTFDTALPWLRDRGLRPCALRREHRRVGRSALTRCPVVAGTK